MSDPWALNTKNRKYASTPLALLDRALHSGSSQLTALTWGPLVSFARYSVLSVLRPIKHGQIVIISPEGTWTFGESRTRRLSEKGCAMDGEDEDDRSEERELKSVFKVVKEGFWVRLALMADIGFSEAYMTGEVEVDNLANAFKIFILNRSELSEMSSTLSSLSAYLHQAMNSRFVNTIQNTLSNISAHYDISNSMFEAFLSKDMTYSCAVYEDAELSRDIVEGPPSEEEEERLLEEAQERKLRRIADRARLADGMRVLEIGSGWGSFAILAASSYNIQIETITLSIEQKHLAEARISAAGLSDRITVHLMDYREVPEAWNGKFDRVVSIEMAEAVGLKFLPTYFGVIHRALKPVSGVAVIQSITIPEGRFDRFRYETDFMKKYIFPGGELASLTFLLTALREGTGGKLICDHADNIGPHYARTLRAWKRRFESKWDTHIVASLVEQYPEMTENPALREVFRRKWLYYWDYTESGFTMRATGDYILTLTREGNLAVW